MSVAVAALVAAQVAAHEAAAERVAVVVMAKRPRPGAVKTRLCPPLTPEAAASFAEAMLLDTLETAVEWAAATPHDVVVRLYLDGPPDGLALPDGVTAHRQADGPLGVQMLRAVVETAARAAGRVLVVGADCPELAPEWLTLAADALASPRTVVLGPAADGGYYLVGVNEITPALFAMDYSHPSVFDDTLARALDAGFEPVILPELDDVDDAPALARAARRALGGEIAGPRTADWLARWAADGGTDGGTDGAAGAAADGA